MIRIFLSGVLAAACLAPLAVSAQTAKPTPAISSNPKAIKSAQQKQLHAQAKTKTNSSKVGVGGGHPDSEVPNNPGETSNKAGAGPGMTSTSSPK